MNSAGANLSHSIYRAFVKLDPGRSSRLAYDFNILPTDACRPTGAECFHHRFLRGEARRVARKFRSQRFAIGDLTFREYASTESLTTPREYLLQTRYFDQIDSDSDNHFSDFNLRQILRENRARKYCASLLKQRGRIRKPAAEVREQQSVRARISRSTGSLSSCRVSVLASLFHEFFGISSFVNQQINASRKLQRRRARTCVQTVCHGFAGPFRSQNLRGMNDTPIVKLHVFSCLQASPQRPFGHSDASSTFDIETTGSRMFVNPVAEREKPMI